jgi:RHS repeat-associated protein
LGSGYRYGFNGKEDDIIGLGGGGATYDYGFRIYNPQIGKFLSVDPLFKEYPWNSPYTFAENDVIRSIDLDGLEKYIVIYWYRNNSLLGATIRVVNNNSASGEKSWLGSSGAIYIKKETQMSKRDLLSYLSNNSNFPLLPKLSKDQLSKGKYNPDGLYSLEQFIQNEPEGNPGDFLYKAASITFGQTDILFSKNNAELSDNFISLLDRYAKYLSGAEGELKVSIQGFASVEGNANDNQILSEKRSKTVKDYLIERINFYNEQNGKSTNPGDVIIEMPAGGATSSQGQGLEINRKVTVDILLPEY